MHHIAHIEDNFGDHVMLQKALGQKFALTHFADIESFIRRKQSFDLIIADLGLVKTFGAETIKAIKAHAHNTPMIALTGLGGPYITGDIVKSIMDAGADNVVSKDIISDARVLDIINELLTLEP